MIIPCTIDRVGGITGKRVYVHRIQTIKRYKRKSQFICSCGHAEIIFNDELIKHCVMCKKLMDKKCPGDYYSIGFYNKSDCLNVKDPETRLEQAIKFKNTQMQQSSTEDSYDRFCLIKFDAGMICDYKLISINEFFSYFKNYTLIDIGEHQEIIDKIKFE